MRRRSFLGLSAAGLAALAMQKVIAEEGTANLEIANLDIIDCHTHFYDPTRPEGIPWPPKESSLYRTVLPEHLRALKMFRRVTGTVIVEASSALEDNQWLLDLAKDDPFIVGIVGHLQPGEADFAKQLKRFAANPLFRGIRANAAVVQPLVDKNELADLKLMADLDLSLDVNRGLEGLAAIAQLAPKLPTLRLVLNHVGNVQITSSAPPSDWRSAVADAAKHPNVFVKISALVEGAAAGDKRPPQDLDFYRPYMDVVWQAFGDERVVYGSNWPVSERAADYETLQRIALQYAFEKGEQVTRQFCSLNAKRAYQWIEREGRLAG
jgi:L-fuconolactonase